MLFRVFKTYIIRHQPDNIECTDHFIFYISIVICIGNLLAFACIHQCILWKARKYSILWTPTKNMISLMESLKKSTAPTLKSDSTAIISPFFWIFSGFSAILKVLQIQASMNFTEDKNHAFLSISPNSNTIRARLTNFVSKKKKYSLKKIFEKDFFLSRNRFWLRVQKRRLSGMRQKIGHKRRL